MYRHVIPVPKIFTSHGPCLTLPQSSDCNASYSFRVFTSCAYEHFIEVEYFIAASIFLFHFNLHLSWHSSFTFEHQYLFVPGKSCSPSPAATGTRYSAVPRHWHNGVLAGFFKRIRQDHLIVWGQHSRVDAATLQPKRVMASSAHSGGRHKFWMYSVAASNVQSWPRTIRLSPVRSFGEKVCVDSITPMTRNRRKSCASWL